MKHPENHFTNEALPEGLGMYFSPEIARKFAELEQNEKNRAVARIVDRVLMHILSQVTPPIRAAELGGGAHPDRYDEFFALLLKEPRGHIDWVDVSPHMLLLAQEYITDPQFAPRANVITFVQNDIVTYLQNLENENLDVAVMKYTIDHIADLDALFAQLAAKLKRGGKLVATIGGAGPLLRNYSTNAKFLYNGQEIPSGETRTLKDGDSYTIHFLKESGNPSAGCLEGAQTTKYFHSKEKIRELAATHGFDIFIGDWKELLKNEDQQDVSIDQEILTLTRH